MCLTVTRGIPVFLSVWELTWGHSPGGRYAKRYRPWEGRNKAGGHPQVGVNSCPSREGPELQNFSAYAEKRSLARAAHSINLRTVREKGLVAYGQTFQVSHPPGVPRASVSSLLHADAHPLLDC